MGLESEGLESKEQGIGSSSALSAGVYIVATPIGNLGDITLRAIDVLKSADLIAAEDTRHTRRLLDALSIQNKLLSLHEHNEFARVDAVLAEVEAGKAVALVSDAGTPLISDPGSILVNHARERGLAVVPVPGPSAVITALSAAGLDCRRFIFEGFLPAKNKAREDVLASFKDEARSVVFYESPHRIQASLAAFAEVLPGRKLVLARELTKTFETFLSGQAPDLLATMADDPNQTKGEFVVLLAGAEPAEEGELDASVDELLLALLDELPVKKAAALAAKIKGLKKNLLYQRALELKD